ncbi:hypothetical protein PbB2_00558 [Candidatus Phycosocius bacilliformis]|uniref:Uncharacterized protein n=1 Tax=Candidatus Phycosocius bacilliformis TaxID=1445552 RepID=A0A2P2E768_9PROT|nr:hypothetical protein [Candidatus Phycosocius bacilliformis]GBF56901.1 hypothetical protein PbB2_00558 [Candidatus Phycosocius bacilliformis]
MDPNLLFFLEFVVFSGTFLAFAIWQVISLSPKRLAAEEAREAARKQAEIDQAEAASEKPPGHAEG